MWEWLTERSIKDLKVDKKIVGNLLFEQAEHSKQENEESKAQEMMLDK